MSKVTKTFLLAGKAIFTVHNNSNEHYTYKVRKSREDSPWGQRYFVSLLTGPDNELSYTYIGILEPNTGVLRLTKQSQYPYSSKAVKVLQWALNVVWRDAFDKVPIGYGIKHEGKCGRCGRTLTTPESIDCGIGPECLKIMGM